jgi:uncharacterized membrane protein
MMTSSIVSALVWTAALSSGLMAGVYFAFSGVIMRSFDTIEASQSIAAMNAINKVILRSLFMPLFFGSTIVSVLLVVFALAYWNQAGAGLMLVAGAVYVVGMFACTAFCNVPLNRSLMQIDPHAKNAQSFWTHYSRTWTRWNHLRTVSCLVTCAVCLWLVARHGL